MSASFPGPSRSLRSHRQWAAAALLLLASAVACNLLNRLAAGRPPDTPTSGPDVVAPPTEPGPLPRGEPDKTLLALGELFDEEGRLPLETALEIFSGTVAPLPGTAPRTLPGENQGAAAHIAAQTILQRMEELPPEVASAVEEALFGNIVEEVEIPPGNRDEGGASQDSGFFLPASYSHSALRQGTEIERLAQLIAKIRPRIESRSGLVLSVPVRAARSGETPTTEDGGLVVNAVARPMEENGSVSACQVVFYEPAFENDQKLEFVVAHELWHCFEFEHAGTGISRQWLIEGQAEWVASEVVDDPTPASLWWQQWLITPHRSMWQRSYNAVGLYAAAQASGADAFGALIGMYRLGNEEAISHLFGGVPVEEALLTVSMSFVRAPEFGPEWETHGRGVPNAGVRADFQISTSPARISLRTARPLGVLPLSIQVKVTDKDFLRLSGLGNFAVAAVEFPGVEASSFDRSGSLVFCLSDRCTCPDGSPPYNLSEPPPKIGRANGVGAVGSLGGGGEFGMRAELSTLEEACRGLVGTWMSPWPAILAANMASYGGVPAEVNCEGETVLTFHEDGTFEYSSQGECRGSTSSGAIVVSGDVACSGTYEDLGTSFVIRASSCDGELLVEGIPGMSGGLRLPLTDNVFDPAEYPYTLNGNQLTYTFTMPDGNVVQHEFTRRE